MLERVLFAGGGTGGHIYMAVALAQELRAEEPRRQFLFVGAQKEVEKNILPNLGFRVESLNIGGLKNLGPLKTAWTLIRLPFSLITSIRIIKRFTPSIMVGLGGYSSGPVLLVGKALGIPSLIIEPNVLPGLTNRLLGYWIDGAAVAYDETASWFGEKARLTGIPVRPQFHKIQTEVSTKGPIRLLIFGGSQGSSALNKLVCNTLSFLPSDQLSLVHQTGTKDYALVKKKYKKELIQAEILEFIDDMPTYFDRADLILSRAGALTLAEITMAGKASILMPFPHASDNHQQKNAALLANRQAAIVLEQDRTSHKDLAQLIIGLISNRDRLIQMSRASRQLARTGGTCRIIEWMRQLENEKKLRS